MLVSEVFEGTCIVKKGDWSIIVICYNKNVEENLGKQQQTK